MTPGASLSQGVVDRLALNLERALGPAQLRPHQRLARYTALRIGGVADLFCVADSVRALCQAVLLAWEHGVPCLILGGGSNVLVSDAGARGLVILNRARTITFSPNGVRAESGASFSTLARQCIAQGLAGLEWAAGIPGTVGGAVIGNAGAWGADVASVLDRAAVMDLSGEVRLWPVERFGYGYRSSHLKQPESSTDRKVVVLEAEFELQPAEPAKLQERAATIAAQRRASQPPGATCGSVFKNPPGDYAGRLIEAAGLKGRRHGGAEISPQHANFFLNRGDASASDVKSLIDLAQKTVQEKFGVAMELEIQLIGEW